LQQSALEDEGETFGKRAGVDVELSQAKAEDYDALMLPGGAMNPDTLRVIPEAVDFVKKFVDAGKPIGAICHGPWTLIEAGGVNGRTPLMATYSTFWPTYNKT
jgi:protease I